MKPLHSYVHFALVVALAADADRELDFDGEVVDRAQPELASERRRVHGLVEDHHLQAVLLSVVIPQAADQEVPTALRGGVDPVVAPDPDELAADRRDEIGGVLVECRIGWWDRYQRRRGGQAAVDRCPQP